MYDLDKELTIKIDLRLPSDLRRDYCIAEGILISNVSKHSSLKLNSKTQMFYENKFPQLKKTSHVSVKFLVLDGSLSLF